MEHDIGRLSWPKGKAKMAGDHPTDAEAEAHKQRRKIQNRKNQRAHRLRIRNQGAGHVQKPHSFRVRNWRLDEPDNFSPQESSLALESGRSMQNCHQTPYKCTGISRSIAELTSALQGSLPTTRAFTHLPFDQQQFTFSLSSDHLLHLIHYNVFRAFIYNKRSLNTWPCDSFACAMNGPCRDDTTVFPLNPGMPSSLIPTTLQQTHDHASWINIIPFPRVRDNLIRHEGCYDSLELMQDLVGDLMNLMPALGRQSMPQSRHLLELPSGIDTDEVTAGRNGLIVWGEPHEIQSWEATPGFLAKWTWAVEGCEELIDISNLWRMKRGEEPMRLSVPRNCSPPPIWHAAS